MPGDWKCAHGYRQLLTLLFGWLLSPPSLSPRAPCQRRRSKSSAAQGRTRAAGRSQTAWGQCVDGSMGAGWETIRQGWDVHEAGGVTQWSASVV